MILHPAPTGRPQAEYIPGSIILEEDEWKGIRDQVDLANAEIGHMDDQYEELGNVNPHCLDFLRSIVGQLNHMTADWF